MGKRVLIDYDLLLDLIKYHLGDLRGNGIEERIYTGLTAKLQALAAHQDYGQKLTGQAAEGRDDHGSHRHRKT